MSIFPTGNIVCVNEIMRSCCGFLFVPFSIKNHICIDINLRKQYFKKYIFSFDEKHVNTMITYRKKKKKVPRHFQLKFILNIIEKSTILVSSYIIFPGSLLIISLD